MDVIISIVNSEEGDDKDVQKEVREKVNVT